MSTWKVEVTGEDTREARAVLERSGFEMSSEPPAGKLDRGKVALTARVEAEDAAAARDQIESTLARIANVSVGQAAPA